MEYDAFISAVLKIIDDGNYLHEPRQAEESKNKLKSKLVDIKFVRKKLSKSKEKNYRMFYDYEYIDREIHEIKFENWYIKF